MRPKLGVLGVYNFWKRVTKASHLLAIIFFRTPTIDSQLSPGVLHRIHSFLNNHGKKLMARRIDLHCFFQKRPLDGVVKLRLSMAKIFRK
jgi:hypothetical protein